MTDARPEEPADPEMSLSETVDLATRRMSISVLAAGAMIGLGLYAARPAPPRYDAFAFGSQIVRVDMKTGSIIACEGTETCQLVLRHGQKLTRVHRTDALPRPPAAMPLPAAPAAGK
jgi:hypothetical protein